MTTILANRAAGITFPEPSQQTTISEPGVNLSIVLFGKPRVGDYNWTLKPFQTPGDEQTVPDLAGRLAQIGMAYGVQNLYAPSPVDFNGRVVGREDFSKLFHLGENVVLHRGVRADGMELAPRSAFLLSTGGCPIIVAVLGQKVVVAHAGLKCLLRWDASEQEHVSVVENIARRFGTPLSRHPSAWTFWSIRQHRYKHSLTDPRYKDESERIVASIPEKKYGCAVNSEGDIDLPLVIRAQLRQHGFSWRNSGPFAYLPPQGYDTRYPEPYNQYRNLIMVVRH